MPIRTLLVVEDDPQVRRMMVRLFSHHFSSVYSTDSLRAAEEVLENQMVTHIILDYHLGIDIESGTALVSSWRRRYKAIHRVMLLTGSRISTLEIPEDVDVAMNKGEDPLDILAKLTEK